MSIDTALATRAAPHPARALLASVRNWVGLAARHRLYTSDMHRGASLRFADGTDSFVFRETVAAHVELTEPSVLVVSFRLRLIGRASLPHALFRWACRLNTPLFGGFEGFATKLWLADTTTGMYRGVYDWNGEEAAWYYAESLCALLRLVSVPGTVRYHILGGVSRAAYLRTATPAGDGADAWWRLREPMRSSRVGAGTHW